MSNPNISEYGKDTRFSSTNQPENSGRKKNRFKHLKGEYELSAEDVNNIVQYVASLNPDELKELTSDKKTPVIILAYATAAYNAIKKGELNQLETMLNRSIGKPSENVNLTTKLPVKIVIESVEAENTNTKKD